MVTKKDKHLAAAQKYLERGSFEKALGEFQNAVKEDPKDTRTWLRMAEVYVRLGRQDKATEVYQKTVDLYVEQGFFQRAVAVYKNIIKLSPDFVDARVKLAEVFHQLGLLSDAVQQLEQAAALFQRANKTTEALNAFKQIIDLNPEQPAPRIRYADLASQTGAIPEAVAEFKEAARLVKAQGRMDEFLRVAERILHYEPENHELALEAAAQYLDANNARAALSRLKGAFEAKQRDPQVLELLARAFEQLGQPHKTLPVLKELARIYAEAGRISERNHVAQRALSLDPNDAEMQELLGKTRTAPRMPTAHAVVAPASTPPSHPSQPSGIPTFTPLGTPAAQHRPVSITFSEMEVPQALRSRYVSPVEPIAPTATEKLSIASGLVERSEDDPEIKRILAEADVFVKYGLVDRAAEHLRRVFERVPTHQAAHERLAAVLVQLGRSAEAAAEYEVLAQQFVTSKPSNASGYARKALELNPAAHRALEILGMAAGSIPAQREPKVDSGLSSELRMGTPEPDIIESDEIELLSDGLESDEFAVTPSTTGAEEIEPGAAALDPAPPTAGTALPEVEAQFEDEGFTEERTSASALPAASDDALQADLEQVDFFMEQGLADEAAAMLDELDARAPGHPAIAERRARLASLSARAAAAQGALPAQAQADVTHSRRASQDLRGPAAAPSWSPPAAASKLDEHDIDTHADLGIMEKTMERYQAAIEHFKMVLADPKRAVFALSMIGECAEALGNSAEAIRCYQDALKRPNATAPEATQLYFQLGNVFYNMGDQSEALYYFERVSKRDPNFRDIQRRLSELKSRPTGR